MMIRKQRLYVHQVNVGFHSQAAAEAFEAECVERSQREDIFRVQRIFTEVIVMALDPSLVEGYARDFERRWLVEMRIRNEAAQSAPVPAPAPAKPVVAAAPKEEPVQEDSVQEADDLVREAEHVLEAKAERAEEEAEDSSLPFSART